MSNLFKHIFKPMQNQDATLNEKSYGVYKAGRVLAWLILIIGSILALLLATWVGNFLQVLIASVVSAFSLRFYYIWPMFKSLFTMKALLSNEYLLDTVFTNNGKLIAGIIRFVALGLNEIYVIKQFLNVFSKYRNLNHHEYGGSRIATPHEVAEETNRIPDREYSYDIPSGTIMMHKMNLKGEVNKVVKQQLFSLITYFQLDKTHDPKGQQFRRFYTTVKAFTLFVFAMLFMGGIAGFFRYNYGSGHAGAAFWPFYIGLAFWDIVHFIGRGIVDLGIDAVKLQIHIITGMPVFFSILVLLAEVLVVVWALANIYRKVHASAEYDEIHSYVQVAKGTPIKKYFENLHKIHIQEYKDLKKGINEFLHPEQIDRENNKDHVHSDKKPIMDHKHPRIYLLHLWLEPVEWLLVHGKHPFLKKPFRAIWMAFLKFLSDVLPLDSGITGWYYITNGNGAMQNVLLYGITRSGKGQMIVNTIIDINSRCSHRYQKNMIFNDSKGELAAMSYKTLKKRGYQVLVLNIMDMSHSMSYNPLALVIQQARAGAIGAAAAACSELSFTIYNPAGQGQNSYFYTSAASLFDSIVFAQLALAHARYYGLDDFKTYKGKNVHDDGKNPTKNKYYEDKYGVIHSHTNAWKLITINNILQMTIQLGGENAQLGSDQLDTANQLIIYFAHLQSLLNDLRDRKNSNPSSMNETLDDHLALLNQAVLEFQNSKMAGGKTAGSIYSTFLDRLRIYQQPQVSQMTSMNSYHAEEMGFDRLFTIQFSRHFKLQNFTAKLFGEKVEKKRNKDGNVITDKNGKPVTEAHIDRNNVIETNKMHLNGIGLAKIPFEKPINYSTFYVEITIHDEIVNQDFTFLIKCHKHYYTPQEYTTMSNNYRIAPKVADLEIVDKGKSDERVIDKYTKKRAMKGIKLGVVSEPTPDEYRAKTSKFANLARTPTNAIRQMRFLYNPRPTALFLVTPPNAPELNQLCTFLINQTFNTLANYGLKIAKGRHIQRPLQFILDELGNIPAIPKLSTKVSIGLSQHIEFLMVFQNFEQIVKNYKKDEAHSIISNCSTTYYILSKSAQTIKQVSDAFGTRTIQSTGLNQDPTKITSANNNSSLMSQKVMPTSVLRHLKPGQIAILRTNDRSTVTGKSVKPWPIFDTGRYVLPYSFWFLKKYEGKDSLNSLPVVTPHKYLNLEDVTVQFNKVYGWLEGKKCLDGHYAKTRTQQVSNEIDNCPLGDNFKNCFNNIMREYVQSGSPTKAIRGANHVEKLIEKYTPLAKTNNLGTLCQYALAVISEGLSSVDTFSTLHDVNPKNQGYQIFNFMVDRYTDSVNYCDEVKDLMENDMPEVRYVKKLRPILYEPKSIQILWALIKYIQANPRQDHLNDKDSSDQYTVEMESEDTAWLVNQVNLIFNQYLDATGLINVSKDNKVHLTKLGKMVIDNSTYMMSVFFKQNKFSYTPNTPMIKIFAPIMTSLKWINKHQEFRGFYGLAFAQSIIDYDRYSEFCSYTGIEKDKSGKAVPEDKELALSPMTYMSAIMTILDAFLFHPQLRHDIKNGYHFTASKACTNALNNFSKLDNEAKRITINSEKEINAEEAEDNTNDDKEDTVSEAI